MTSEQRQAVHNVLMRGVRVTDDDGLRAILSAMSWHDVNELEPLIDQWVIAGYRAGQRFADRLTEEEILHLGDEK